jgi:hypothetical protein
VIVDDVHVVLEKLRYTVVPDPPLVGFVDIVSVFPPAVYPVPDTSFDVVYAVVAALNVALDVYRAILNVCAVSLLKSISPSSSACLKLVHIACVIAISSLL